MQNFNHMRNKLIVDGVELQVSDIPYLKSASTITSFIAQLNKYDYSKEMLNGIVFNSATFDDAVKKVLNAASTRIKYGVSDRTPLEVMSYVGITLIAENLGFALDLLGLIPSDYIWANIRLLIVASISHGIPEGELYDTLFNILPLLSTSDYDAAKQVQSLYIGNIPMELINISVGKAVFATAVLGINPYGSRSTILDHAVRFISALNI